VRENGFIIKLIEDSQGHLLRLMHREHSQMPERS